MASAKWRRLQCMALALALGLAVQCSFADAVNPDFKLVDRKLAECGVVIEHYKVSEQDLERYRESDEGIEQFWLADAEKPSQRARLCVVYRAAEVVISPDGSRLILNEHPVSDHSGIALYQRLDKIHYKPLENVDLGKPIWEFYLKQNRLPRDSSGKPESTPIPPFDHAYIDCVAWSHDGSAFMVKLLGYNGSPGRTHDWFCIYDLKTNRPTLDLNVMNRDSAPLQTIHQ